MADPTEMIKSVMDSFSPAVGALVTAVAAALWLVLLNTKWEAVHAGPASAVLSAPSLVARIRTSPPSPVAADDPNRLVIGSLLLYFLRWRGGGFLFRRWRFVHRHHLKPKVFLHQVYHLFDGAPQVFADGVFVHDGTALVKADAVGLALIVRVFCSHQVSCSHCVYSSPRPERRANSSPSCR